MADETGLNDYMEKAGGVLASLAGAAMEGGQIQAAWRQGLDEIGTALKAFPDAIQVDEPGTVGNPLYRNMPGEAPAMEAASVEPAALPSPSQIADAAPPQGSVYGESQAMSGSLPSPSEIVADPSPYIPPPADMGNVQGQERGPEMGREM